LLTRSLRRILGVGLEKWMNFWCRVEGPELEPPLWHSHFMSSFVAARPLRAYGARLQGLIIDVGTGTGHGAKYLNPTISSYFPTDLKTGRDAKNANISRAGRAPVFNCSVYEIPFPTGHFGGAMMLSVLEHLEHPKRGLEEILRVLTPGGLLLLSVPFAFPVHGAPHDFRRWTRTGLELELRHAGFEIVESSSCGGSIAAIAMNAHLAIRHHLVAGNYLMQKLVTLAMPVLLVVQVLVNWLAWLLDRLDRSCAFPLVVLVLARKPQAAPRQDN